MDKIIEELPAKAKEKWVENKKYFAKLKRKPRKRLDLLMKEIHDDEFKHTDCLTCANCHQAPEYMSEPSGGTGY